MGKGGKFAVFSPAGVKSWIELRDNILNVKQLKERAVDALPWTPVNSPLSKCKFLPTSKIHMVLKRKGLGRSKENLWLSFHERKLQKSTFLPTSTIHLVLKFHGG